MVHIPLDMHDYAFPAVALHSCAYVRVRVNMLLLKSAQLTSVMIA